MQENSSNPWYSHHPVSLMGQDSYAGIQCCPFSKWNTSIPFCSHLSTEHFPSAFWFHVIFIKCMRTVMFFEENGVSRTLLFTFSCLEDLLGSSMTIFGQSVIFVWDGEQNYVWTEGVQTLKSPLFVHWYISSQTLWTSDSNIWLKINC